MNQLANLAKLTHTNAYEKKLKNESDGSTIVRHLMEEQTGGKKSIPIPSNDNLELVPISSTSKNFIELNFPDIKVGQCAYSDGPVGLTFIQFQKGARMYKEKRGGWPADIDMLSANDKQMIGGINIAGGSILGLESTTGIIAESLKQSGYKGWWGVNGAIIYSGNLDNNKIYPDKELGRFAFTQSDDKLFNGQVGAGLSASHGQGWGFKQFSNGMKILALCVNNALGSVYKDNEPVHHPHGAKKPHLDKIKFGKNTTIICLVTNVDLDIDELRQLNHQVNVSVGESIRPFNTLTDGDILYTCSTRKIKHKFSLGQAIKFFDECSQVLKEAILNSIK